MRVYFVMLLAIIISWYVEPLSASPTRDGGGIVYHRSDCGYSNVRFYGLGGDGDGSTCWDQWMNPVNFKTLNEWDRGIIHSADFNFKAEELACVQNAGQADGIISAPGLRKYVFVKARFDQCGIGFVYDNDSFPFTRDVFNKNNTVDQLNAEYARWKRWPQFGSQ